MLNQAKPALVRGSNRGRTLVLRLPSSKPPPWIRMAAGKGPGPSGTCRSRSWGWPLGRAYSTSFRSRGEAHKAAANRNAESKTDLPMERDCSAFMGGDNGCDNTGYAETYRTPVAARHDRTRRRQNRKDQL